jgi:hypothetical protein
MTLVAIIDQSSEISRDAEKNCRSIPPEHIGNDRRRCTLTGEDTRHASAERKGKAIAETVAEVEPRTGVDPE